MGKELLVGNGWVELKLVQSLSLWDSFPSATAIEFRA